MFKTAEASYMSKNYIMNYNTLYMEWKLERYWTYKITKLQHLYIEGKLTTYKNTKRTIIIEGKMKSQTYMIRNIQHHTYRVIQKEC